MPRIANLTNFEGEIIASQPWVLQQIENITAGTNKVFINNSCDTENLATYMASLSSATGNVVIVKDGTAKGSYIFTDSNGNYQLIILDAATESAISALASRVTTVENDISNIVTKVTDGNDTTYTIKPGVLPDLAITNVYTINASASTNLNKTVNALLAAALGDNQAQTGDVIIVTAESQARAEAVAGNYIIIHDVEDPGNISSVDYVKMYTGTGSVVSVNQVAPIAGNVQLSITDLDNVSVTYVSGTQTVDTISLVGVEIAKASDLTEINEAISDLEQDISDLAGVNDDIDDIQSDIAEIKEQQTNNITAIQRAVQLVETTLTIQDGQNGVTVTIEYDTDGVTIKNRTVTIVSSGHILQVWDANGKMIIPDITYSGNVAMLTAKYGTRSLDSTWTLLRTVPIEVERVSTSSEESSEDSSISE